MIFNSIDFAVFLPIVFIIYWLLPNKKIKLQNLLIVAASYFFYGSWDWRFLSLILTSTIVDYFVGLRLSKVENKNARKILLGISIIVNLGLLGFFKYYNFFLDNFITVFSFFGTEIRANSLNVILPVGISFYTFQTLSYSIDVYKRKLEPTKDFIAFAAFVSFFPQLVAGPIERAMNLIPQFTKPRQFDYNKAVSGVKLIIWGLFKKMVIADNAATIVDGVFNNYSQESTTSLLIGIFLFSFQIYCDFSGYSDIAIGTSRLFGFDLMTNFKFPYFSKNIREFWGRWHISLSTWFRDYVFIPLGGSRVSLKKVVINILIVFLVSGFWHGANWTFILWGFLHAIFYLPMLANREKRSKSSSFIPLKSFLLIFINFSIVTLAWIFFRAENIGQAVDYIIGIIQFDGGGNFYRKTLSHTLMTFISFGGILLMLIIEYFAFRKNRTEIFLPSWSLILFMIAICLLGVFKNQPDFIYFQF